MKQNKKPSKSYWHANLYITIKVLIIWFSVSFGCGILFKEELDQFFIGGAPLVFWMAQQGYIICFVLLLIAYSFLMNNLDKKYGYDEEGE